jgi:hypothetical protein
MNFTVSDGISAFHLSKQECIDLELKLNVTAYGHPWVAIGDALFNWGSNKLQAADFVDVSTFQYEFLKMLREKSGWEACKNLK